MPAFVDGISAEYGLTGNLNVSHGQGIFSNLPTDLIPINPGGNGGLAVQGVTNAVNSVVVTNSVVGQPPSISVVGPGATISLSLIPKGVSGQVLFPTGNASTPSIAFASQLTTGIYLNAGPGVTLTANGVGQLSAFQGNLRIAALTSLSWGAAGGSDVSAPDVLLFRDAAATLALRNGANPQAFNIYNTYTDASNYERVNLSWDAGSGGQILQSQAAGTGSVRPFSVIPSSTLYLGANASPRWYIVPASLNPLTDAITDIGDATHRVRNFYAVGGVATKVKAGTPVDGDFTNPVDGMLAIDSTNNKIMVRIGGAWKGILVA
jgi:hypothetical protein